MSLLRFGSEKEKWGELSNFWRTQRPIVYEGREYPTSEHLYQALKYIYPGASDLTLEYADVQEQVTGQPSTPLPIRLATRTQRPPAMPTQN